MENEVLIHPEELSKKWIDRAKELKIDAIGLHPVGGLNAADSLAKLLKTLETAEFRALINYAEKRSIFIEYEMHSASFLVPRFLFHSSPEIFKMNESGERTADYNFCTASESCRDLLEKNSFALAEKLYKSRHNYYFWADDARGGSCRCDKCKALSSSDEQLLSVNIMLKGIRKLFPDAKMAYLAYFDRVSLPRSVEPEKGVFLEYAPFEKYRVEAEGNALKADNESAALPALLDFFGKKDSKVLEYWLDNSLYSNWTKPPKKFKCDERKIESDLVFYKKCGFEKISTFACYLGADYEALYGAPDITPFSRAYGKVFKD